MSRYRPITVPLPDVPGAALGGGEWAGDGFPVLAIPGLGSNHRAMELFARVVPDHQIVAVDARGRASGAGIPSPNGLTTHADDLVAVLDATGVDKAVVVGHSMGGFVGLRFAQRHPDRVQGLLLVDGGPPVVLPGILRSARAVRFTFNLRLPKDRTYEDFADYWAKASKRAASYEELDDEFVRWGFEIDLAGEPGALRPRADRSMLLDDAAECFTAAWRAQALREIEVPCRILLCEWGAAKGKKPLYRKDPDPSTLSPTITVERLAGTDHLQALWHPTTVAAVSAFVPA
ncbi:MAG TPA: alpha/beta hydrolase [Nocardioides sp.]|nr:alpha/beta hydrolase [Nocardioides sp.]